MQTKLKALILYAVVMLPPLIASDIKTDPLPPQATNAGKFLATNGLVTSWQPAQASAEIRAQLVGNTVVVGPTCSAAAPCVTQLDDIGQQRVASQTASAPVGTGTVYFYIDALGVLRAGHNLGVGGLTCTAGMTCTQPVVAFPAGSIHIATATVTLGVFDVGGLVNWFPLTQRDNYLAGTGLILTGHTFSVDATLVTMGVTINGGAAIVTPNFNNTTPAPVTTGSGRGRELNVTWKSAASNVSAQLPISSILVRPTLRRWGMWVPAGTTTSYTSLGDTRAGTAGTISTVAPDATNGTIQKYASAALAASAAGDDGQLNWRTSRNVYLNFVGYIGQVTEVRSWIGLVSAGSTFTDTETPAGNGAAFWFSNCTAGCAGHTNWMCYVRNAGAASVPQDSGVVPSTTTATSMEIAFDDVASTITFFIAGAQVCQFTAADQLPAAGTNLRSHFTIVTQAIAERDIYYGSLYASADK